MALENVLHVAPNAIANCIQHLLPARPARVTGAFSLANFANPVWFVCGMIGAVANTTAPETAKLCAAVPRSRVAAAQLQQPADADQPLPAARRPTRTGSSTPTRSSRPAAQGRATRPRPPPAVSAYTGIGRRPAASRLGPAPACPATAAGPACARRDGPATPSPALIRRAPPIPGPPTSCQPSPADAADRRTDMLLPPSPAAPRRIARCTAAARGRDAARHDSPESVSKATGRRSGVRAWR